MAVRAVAVLRHAGNYDYPNGQFGVTASVAIIGSNYGQFGIGRFEMAVEGINASDSATNIRIFIQTAIKNYMLSKGVPFGVNNGDSVRILTTIN